MVVPSPSMALLLSLQLFGIIEFSPVFRPLTNLQPFLATVLPNCQQKYSNGVFDDSFEYVFKGS